MEFKAKKGGVPMIASSCIATENTKNIRRLIKSGVDGAILKSCADYIPSTDAGKRHFAVYDDCLYASSPFEKEILTAAEALALLCELRTETDILLIPSFTANSLDAEQWLPWCKKFEAAGADAVQLDFFYMGALLYEEKFAERFVAMLKTLREKTGIVIMPKLNINLPKDYIIPLIKEAGIEYVSLLDSIRVPCIYIKDGKAQTDTRLDADTTSCFGGWQFPLTLGYTYTAAKHGLKVCAGGGITCREDIQKLAAAGASAVQSACFLTKHMHDWQKYLG